MREAEVVLYFIDASREYGNEETQIENILEYINIPIIKVYTKLDLPSKINIPKIDENIEISSISKS
jgi:GTP1/Obg family GTP-binding protein